MAIAFAMLAAVVLCTLPDVLNYGWGDTYELTGIVGGTIHYRVHRRDGESVDRVNRVGDCLHLPTREIEFLNDAWAAHRAKRCNSDD